LLVDLTRAGQQTVEKGAPNAIASAPETLALLTPGARDAGRAAEQAFVGRLKPASLSQAEQKASSTIA
jgi:hypothetical protein